MRLGGFLAETFHTPAEWVAIQQSKGYRAAYSPYRVPPGGQKTRYAYCASKAALNIQSILLQNHVAEYGIKVHLIEPGWLRTFLASKEKCTIAPPEPEESAELLVAFLQRNPPPAYMFHDLFQDQQFDW